MSGQERTDAELMSLVQSRDADAFDALRLRHEPAILRHLRSIVHDRDAADDLLQETLLRVWVSAGQWDGRGAVKGWIFRIATNLALNSVRTVRRRREARLDTSEDDDSHIPAWMIDTLSPTPADLVEDAERAAEVRRLVDELPEEKRELMRMVYDAEMEVRQAAEALGIPEGTAKSRLHYSTKYIARRWRDQDNV
jgi:RNA polymerase sigma-70 factor (ECF subfamily)